MRKIKLAAFIVSLILLGFVRESFFVNLNILMYNKYYAADYPLVSWLIPFKDVSYKTLYVGKWLSTPFFALLFAVIQYYFLRYLFPAKNANKWLVVLYLSLFLLAGIFFMTGWALGNIYKGYTFSRHLMGFLQSPLPCLVMIPIAYFDKHNSLKIKP